MPPELDPSTVKEVCDALRNDDWTAIKALIEANPGLVSNEHFKDTTLLHHAAFRGNLDIVRWLIEERGCSIAAQDPSGRSALYHATRADSPKNAPVVEYLCECHAPIDAGNVLRMVHMGAFHSNDETAVLETFRCMLRYSTSEAVNYMDHRFYTPLATACIRAWSEMARLLLLAGAKAYETYPFTSSNAVRWDSGNRNALLKAQAVFRNDSVEKRAAKKRCVALIETIPRIVLLRKCRELHGACRLLQSTMKSAEEMEVDDEKKAMQLSEARERLGGMSFLCDRVGSAALPIFEINEGGANEVVGVCVRHVVEGGLVPDVWREVLEMLDV